VKALVLCGAVWVALSMYALRGRMRPALATAGGATLAAICAIALLLPGADSLWARLHGTTPDRMITVEDGSGLAVLKADEQGFTGKTMVFTNGLGQSEIPFPDWGITLGLVSAMVHPNPQQIAVIGVGSGGTLFAVGGREETRRMTAIEIVEPLHRTLGVLRERTPYGGLASLLADPRVTYVFADARAVIRLGDRKYDLIVADALRPTSAYAGNLYSTEHFTLLRGRLNPGGVAVTYAPTDRVVDTFARVFPHSMFYRQGYQRIMIGSNEPLAWNGAEAGARAGSRFSTEYYARAGVDVGSYVRYFATARPAIYTPDSVPAAARADLNSDLFPRDEFLVPRAR
jgi:spermidine synthase